MDEPKITLIEDGKEVGNWTDPGWSDPNMMRDLYAAVQAAQLVKLRKLEEAKIPTGVKTYPIVAVYDINALDLNDPLISFVLINDGPGAVVIGINGASLDINNPINVGESLPVNMIHPVINEIRYRTTAPGTTATCRIFAIEGRDEC